MRFANPQFLYALIVILIPIIIHLFNFRRYQVRYFSNTTFIEFIKKQTHRESELKKWIILILRTLAIACIVLVFAKPYIPNKNYNNAINTNPIVALYIDNSFSMESKSIDDNLLYEAKQQAKNIIGAYPESCKFRLITNELASKYQYELDKSTILQEIDNLQTSSINRSLSDIYIYVKRDIQQNKHYAHLYLLSDWQKTTSDFQKIEQDTSIQTFIVPFEANKIKNISIDSAWLLEQELSEKQNIKMFVRISNHSEDNIEGIPIKLVLDGQQKAIASLKIDAKKTIETSLNFTLNETNIQKGYISLTDNPIIFDDKLHFVLNVNKLKNILHIYTSQENRYIKQLFEDDSTILYSSCNYQKIDYQQLKKQNLVLLECSNAFSDGFIGEMFQYVENGGNLLLIAPNIEEKYNNKIHQAFNVSNLETIDNQTTKIESLNIEHPFYQHVFDEYPENIDLPEVFIHYKFSKQIGKGKQTLISLENNDALLTVEQFGNGAIFAISIPFDNTYSKFPEHAIFVPTLLNMSFPLGSIASIYQIIGDEKPISLPSSSFDKIDKPILTIKNENNKEEFIPNIIAINPQIQFIVNQQVYYDGIYDVFSENQHIGSIAFNYNRQESNMDFYQKNDLLDLLSQYQLSSFKMLDIQHKNEHSVQTMVNNNKTELFQLFLLFALLFLLAESILIRIFLKEK